MSDQENDLALEKGTLAPRILADDPVTTADELRGDLERFAKRLSRILEHLPASSPVLVHGDWGIGKTSLLHAIERHVAPRPVIWFHAWRYERETSLLPALLRQVWESTPENFRKKGENQKRYRQIWNAAVVLAARLVPVVLTAFGGGLLEPYGPAAARDDVNALGDKSREPRNDAGAEIWTELTLLVKEAWPGERPLVLVDDLDRCSSEGAVALLDGIRILVTGRPSGAAASETSSLHFLVALDRLVLVHAVSKKFDGIADYDGNRYLEKIFPLSFAVPAPYEEDAAALVARFLDGSPSAKAKGNKGEVRDGGKGDERTVAKGNSPPGKSAASVLGDQRGVLSEALKNPLFANPRMMKRCINRFRLVTYFEQGTEPSATPLLPAETLHRHRALAKWIAATERWPALRPLVLRRNEDYWTRLQTALGVAKPAKGTIAPDAPTNLDVEASAMVTDPRLSNWLRTEFFPSSGSRLDEYRQAEERLRRWGL